MSILIAGTLYEKIGGQVPLMAVELPDIVPLLALGMTFLLVNYVGVGLFIASRGRTQLETYIRAIDGLFGYEGIPLSFAPLVALVATRLGTWAFLSLTVGIMAVAVVARSLAYQPAAAEASKGAGCFAGGKPGIEREPGFENNFAGNPRPDR